MEYNNYKINGRQYQAKNFVDGILINPLLPEDFDNTPNDERSKDEIAMWYKRPYITTQENFFENGSPSYDSFLKAWPENIRYNVRCLDGGAWDRSTNKGSFATLDEAVSMALLLTTENLKEMN